MAIMEDYMFFPGKVEQWVCIIETNEGIVNYPVKVIRY